MLILNNSKKAIDNIKPGATVDLDEAVAKKLLAMYSVELKSLEESEATKKSKLDLINLKKDLANATELIKKLSEENEILKMEVDELNKNSLKYKKK